jgi:hypothetical protein
MNSSTSARSFASSAILSALFAMAVPTSSHSADDTFPLNHKFYLFKWNGLKERGFPLLVTEPKDEEERAEVTKAGFRLLAYGHLSCNSFIAGVNIRKRWFYIAKIGGTTSGCSEMIDGRLQDPDDVIFAKLENIQRWSLVTDPARRREAYGDKDVGQPLLRLYGTSQEMLFASCPSQNTETSC